MTYWQATDAFDPAVWRQRWAEDGAAAEARAADIISELRSLVGSVNALHIVGQVSSWMTVGIANAGDGAERFGREAQAEFLSAVALESGLPEGPPAGPQEVNRAMHLVAELFEAEDARIMAEEAGEEEAGNVLDEARFMLRHEALRDRTQGYVPHLTRIIESVFEPLRDVCVSAVGFCPADIPVLVHTHVQARQSEFQARLDASRQIPDDQVSGLGVPPSFVRFSWVVYGLNDPQGDFEPAALADAAGLPRVEVEALLRAMTTSWRQPLTDVRPGRHLMVRRRPVLDGQSGRVSWPLTWSSMNEALPWFNDVVADVEAPGLKEAVSAARASATEELVTEAFASVFGADLVHPNFEYPIPGANWTECDVVVELPGHAVAVECKSGALNDDYRAGDIGRAELVFQTLVDDPFGQSNRAAAFLAKPGRWRIKGTGEKREWKGVSEVSRVAVSLERIDPLALVAARATLSERAGTATWVVCLADLLMIAEVLDNKHAFFAYLKLRTDLASNPAVAVISEADLLGAFLHDRLRMLRSAASEPGALVGLDTFTQDLDAYFTTTAMGLPASRKPAVRISDRHQRILDDLWGSGDASWSKAVMKHVVDR